MVIERGSDVEECWISSPAGQSSSLLYMRTQSITKAAQVAGLKVATRVPCDHPCLFQKTNVDVDVVLVGGACEATPHLGIADDQSTCPVSGTTLESNRLRVIDEVMATSTRLIANRESIRAKKEKIDEISILPLRA